ncbi:MAG TPA: S46 family peptidase [Longimicrobiales bacterium]|nr:S46 family peptidase [Longimicrobiales bacterium]
MKAKPFFPILLLAAVAGLSACASAAPATTTPTPSTPATGTPTAQPPAATGALVPSEAALRASETIELTGRELGTMWTFENAPLEYWRTTYGFSADQQWLDQVRLASVRVGTFCSGSFVSPEGLVMTNHHCARECVEAQSTGDTDYVEQGFYAGSREDEALCPGLYLDQLVGIDDVTARVQGAAPAGASATAVTEAMDAEIERIESECESAGDNECQVVSLFHGGQYQLYQYHRFQPVKLVWAPELQAGFFGGDPDNFTYPRYALDAAFLRAYDGDETTPAQTPYFPWRRAPIADGELVFVTGNPGSTSRMITVSELMYEQRFRHPFLVQLLRGQRDFLQSLAEANPQMEQQVRQQLFSVENSLKAYSGQLAGLRDTTLVARKIRWEREFRDAVNRDAALRAEYGDVWDRLAAIHQRKLAVAPRVNITNPEFVGAPHIMYARNLVDYVQQAALPEAQQSEAFRENRAQIEQMLNAPSQVDPRIASALLELYLELAWEWLPAGDPLRAALFDAGEDPTAAARRITAASRVLDQAYRRQVMDGGAAALANTTDPLLRFAAAAGPLFPELTAELEQLNADEAVQEERLAKALFAVYGADLPPDATFTLRITDGVVSGYPYNGTQAPPFTTFYGMYNLAAGFDNEFPWELPASFAQRAQQLDKSVPLDFVSTNDITGGNSGSPLIDREMRVVGLAFDSNIEGLPNEFLFRPDSGGRTVSVAAAGILEALRSVYQATALVNEILATAR